MVAVRICAGGVDASGLAALKLTSLVEMLVLDCWLPSPDPQADRAATNNNALTRRALVTKRTTPLPLKTGKTTIVAARSDVEVDDVERIFLDELPARFDLVAHEHGEYLVRGDAVLHADLEESADLRVHRGLPELLRAHLTPALVALARLAAPGFC